MRTSAAGTDTLDHKRLFRVLSEYQGGDFAVRMPDDCTGLAGKICDALNTTIERNERLVREIERLSAVVGKADEGLRLKDEVLATLSHELRTPLNAIMGWAHVLGQGTGDRQTVQRAADVIRQNAAAQAQLIEDLLDVSRMVGGKLHLESSTVDLCAIIEAAIESVMPAATAKGITIERQMPAVACATGDRDRLQQVVWNLLSNALKFTPKGGQVTVGLIDGEGEAEIFVIDNGIGIAADFLPYVFDRFRQADSSMSRRHSGLGLGMAIVRHLVELHGGTVSVESAGEGRGATFWLRLPTRRAEVAPVHRVEEAETEPESPPAELERLHGLHVLIVDDDADSRNVLALLLQKLGALVEAVPSAREAVARVTQRRPDVIVSDIGMPEEDGYSLIRRLRQMPADIDHKLPAIALTAYARKQDADAAIDAGYDRHLPKPVAPAELVRAIRSVVVNCG